jgi:hypothetical protein
MEAFESHAFTLFVMPPSTTSLMLAQPSAANVVDTAVPSDAHGSLRETRTSLSLAKGT